MTTFLDDVTVEDLDADPYRIYARMRAELPVAHVPAVDSWFVTRHADVAFVAEHPDLFPAAAPGSPVERSFGAPTIITVDGPVHHDLRRAFDGNMRPKRVEGYVEDLVRPIAARHAAALAGAAASGEPVDLLATYFEPISVLSLAAVLGLDLDAQTLRRWFHGMSLGAINYEQDPARQAEADAVLAEVDAVVVPLLEHLAAHPDDSTLSHMLHAGRPAGDPRPVDLVLPSVKVAILGGMQEPGHGAASTLAALLAAPAQLAAVLAERTLVAAAVEEGTRWVTPIGTQFRTAARDVEVGGATVPAGAGVSAVLASANRDAAVFPEPDVFDLFRHVPGRAAEGPVGAAAAAAGQAAYGFGKHFCSGHSFARHQMRIALEELLAAFPSVRPADDGPVEFRGWEFRAPVALPVLLG
ncbi:cytochrome P450 [Kineosporia sp. R_H_3]|uniref:cytochrome P450 n=1 Tax=Kineosporia sp. R_H_3 TaxID=1961848 RepID=UPI000B4B2629|nr:cytochrome P450 [Kineosporia sp. R_H_3]